MRITVGQVDPKAIDVFDDGWSGRGEGIRFGEIQVWLSDQALDALSVVVGMLQTERAMAHAERERDETLSNCGPETAGFEREVA